jgi:hypothetical protein
MERLSDIAVDERYGRLTNTQIGETIKLLVQLFESPVIPIIKNVAPALLQFLPF